MFLVISDRLCIISLSLNRFITCRSLSLEQSESIASISLSSTWASEDLLRTRLGVSGSMIRKVSLRKNEELAFTFFGASSRIVHQRSTRSESRQQKELSHISYLNAEIKSIFDRWVGNRILSSACRTALRLLADAACRRMSRVSLFTTY